MAGEFEDLGFWLPSEFLTDDDLLTDFKSPSLRTTRFEDFCYGKSFGYNSDLRWASEMVSSPTETESENDDPVSELTRKLSRSTLRNPSFSSHYSSKEWKMCSSPESTLCGCKFSSTGSPESVSGVCSPPEVDDYLRREYLYAAAEEVASMRMIEKTAAFYSSKLVPPPAKPSPSLYAGFYPIQARSQSRISAQLLLAAKQQQLMKKGVYGPRVAEFQLQKGRAQGLSMAAGSGLQQPGSRTPEVFVGAPEPKKERTGTGVFLPKRLGSIPADRRKKSEKVVHALNLNVESIDAHLHPSINYGTSNFDHDSAAALKHRSNVMMMAPQQRRNLGVPPATNHQLSLTQEWSY